MGHPSRRSRHHRNGGAHEDLTAHPVRPGGRQAGRKNLWRKQLLPLAKITYEGRVIDFTKDYLSSLVTAFNDRAYDQVPFQLADAENTHTEAPERYRGEIAALEMTDDGLDVIVAVTDDGAQVLRDNPRLGVSARITEDYPRADGKFYSRALKHVLGTLDPRLTGMRPWQAIDATADEGQVIDLTALEYATQTGTADAVPAVTTEPETAPETKETGMALTADQEARLGKLLDLPAEQFDALLAPPEKPAEGDTGTEDEQLTDDELAALVASLDDDLAPGGEGAPAGTEPEKETAGASLTAEAQAQIDLANARADETSMALKRVTSQLATTAYESERDLFARTYGIPPRITDLARGLLEGEGRVVELANGKRADAGAIVREVLKEVGKTVKMLDLTAELGSPLDGGAEAAAAAEADAVTARKDLVSAVRGMTGI